MLLRGAPCVDGSCDGAAAAAAAARALRQRQRQRQRQWQRQESGGRPTCRGCGMQDTTQRSFYVGRPASPAHAPRAPAAENAAWSHASGGAMAMDAPWSHRQDFSDSLCNPKRPAAKPLTHSASRDHSLVRTPCLVSSGTLVPARPRGQINPLHELGQCALHTVRKVAESIH